MKNSYIFVSGPKGEKRVLGYLITNDGGGVFIPKYNFLLLVCFVYTGTLHVLLAFFKNRVQSTAV
jgi:hypothetical protein